MHFALLIGYGASAINPYLAIETIHDLKRRGLLPDKISAEYAEKNFIKAINKGLLKTFSKMGISTLQSYRGAQVFEAVGLNRSLIEDYFPGTASRIEGVGLGVLAREAQMKHDYAFQPLTDSETDLVVGGQYQYREGGEYPPAQSADHQQGAARGPQQQPGHVPGIHRPHRRPEPQLSARCAACSSSSTPTSRSRIEEVEPAKEIVKRFTTGAMSFGSISKGSPRNPRHRHEPPRRHVEHRRRRRGRSPLHSPTPTAIRAAAPSSRLPAAASASPPTTSSTPTSCRSKWRRAQSPAKAASSPATRSTSVIARIRHSIPGVGLISPPPHHDIYSIEDLAQLIYDLKNVNPQARIAVKLVSEVGVGTVAAGVSKAHADVVLISGDTGGTGASPLSSIKHAGLPWELGLAETQQVLLLNDLRSRIRVQTDGKLQTGRDVVIAALLGAEEFGFATMPLISMGCIMMRKCHLNTCAVGIATQDPVLRARFTGTPEHVINFFFFIAEQMRQHMAKLGFRTVDEMVGRVDKIDDAHRRRALEGQGHRPLVDPLCARRCPRASRAAAPPARITASARRSITRSSPRPSPRSNRKTPVTASFAIRNVHRTVGAMLGGEIARRYGSAGLPDGTIHFKFRGSAGQSFGAFVPNGVTLELEGDANDYLGKGLSGGRIIAYPPKTSSFLPEESILVGNVVLYGATSGEVFLNGIAGERFAVRNSGATAVVEGVGDHGCEYMTNGLVIVLGSTGRNFAAGMSGGIAYVYDDQGDFATRRCNKASVDLEPLVDSEDIETSPRPARAPSRPHRQPARRMDPGALGRRAAAIHQGLPARVQARSRCRARASRLHFPARRVAAGRGRQPRCSMGKVTGFLEIQSRAAHAPQGRRAHSTTGSKSTSRSPRRSSASRALAAWTAACPSATPAARSTISSPTGTISSTTIAGRPPFAASTPPTTFLSSPAASAPPPAKPPASSASISRRSPSSSSSAPSSSAPGTKAGFIPSRPSRPPASASPSSAAVPQASPPRSNFAAPATPSPSTRRTTASAACSATAFPTSSLKSTSSIAASSR